MSDVLNDEELGHLKLKDLRKLLLHFQTILNEDIEEEEEENGLREEEDKNLYKHIL